MAKIFVVDDNPDVLATTLAVFSKRGYDVVGASNGIDAIKMVRTVYPDLIISDIVMPQMDGFKFFKQLKDTPFTAAIPILMISGHGQMVDIFVAMGCAGFLIKPFSTRDLLNKVEQILNKTN
jgi:CheY-like chemotaxis protein